MMQQPPSANSADPKPRQSENIVVQALSMAFGTMASRILGLIRDMAFAAMFNRTITDAWGVAFRLPNMFRRLLGEGSLSVSFIPVFVEARVKDPAGRRAHNLVNSFYTLLLLVLTVLTTLGIVFAEPILRLLLGHNFDDIPGKFELTVHLARIMFIFIFLMSTYAFFMGVLNALGKFALPALAPTLFNVAMIISNFYPKAWQAIEGDALAWGVVVGGALQAGILLPALMKLGYFPKLSFDFRHPDVSRIWRNMLPGMLGTGLLQITTIVNTRFASSLGEGSNTYIYLADRLLELPLSLVSVSLGTALLPSLATMWARNEKEHMTATSNYYLRLNLYIAVPAAIGLYFMAIPIVELLFQRGKFSVADTMFTASVVQIYAFTLISSSSVRVVVPAFYAIKNTWLPAVVSGVCLIVHILIAPILMRNYGIEGLVFSTLISASLNLLFLLISYRFLIGSFGMEKIFFSLMKFCAAGAGLGIVTLSYDPLFGIIHQLIPSLSFARLISVLMVVGVGCIVYGGMSHILKVEEYRTTADLLLGKVRRRLKK